MKEQFADKIKSVVELLMARGCKPLAFGRHKAVFVKGNLVYRVPRSFSAVHELLYEDEFVKLSNNGKFYWKSSIGGNRVYVLLPRTRLITINGVMVQIMEKLAPIPNCDAHKVSRTHKWLPNLCLANDGEQAGFNRSKKLRCYDFANLRFTVGCEHKAVMKADARYNVFMESNFGKVEFSGISSEFFTNLGLKHSYGCPHTETVESMSELLKFA